MNKAREAFIAVDFMPDEAEIRMASKLFKDAYADLPNTSTPWKQRSGDFSCVMGEGDVLTLSTRNGQLRVFKNSTYKEIEKYWDSFNDEATISYLSSHPIF